MGELNNEIANLKRQLAADPTSTTTDAASKKRKFDHEPSQRATDSKPALYDPSAANGILVNGPLWTQMPSSVSIDGISFLMPQRKKFDLHIVPGSSQETGGIVVRSRQENTHEELRVRWADIGKPTLLHARNG